MRLPYGISNFGELRRQGFYYVDKTEFIPLLESGERGRNYLIFLRPRRFGKSTLISMLEHYYDVAAAGEFEALFGDLEVGRNPTPERNRYFILRLEFTGITTDSGPERLHETFRIKLIGSIQHFIQRYEGFWPRLTELAARLQEIESPSSLLTYLFSALRGTPHPLYVLIDEYDNFTNDLIARGDHDIYKGILHASGFVREFYKTLKEGTTALISRIFMTGVSPVTLDDLTSGFNITKNISQHADFSELAGFTTEEVATLTDGVLRAGGYTLDRDVTLADIRELYNGYLFSRDSTARVCNPDMVLHFLTELTPPSSYPSELLDMNVRTDYGRLRRMLLDPDGRVRPGPLSHVQQVIQEGYIDAILHTSFSMDQAWQEEYFVSLLYYLGLLTLEAPVRRLMRLTIPNTVIETLYWENLQGLLNEVTGSRLPTTELVKEVEALAFGGDFEPFLRLLVDRVFSRLSNRDFRQLNEKPLKMVLLTYLAVSGVYEPWSEPELKRGYADLILLLRPEYADAPWQYLIEVKYLKEKEASPERIETKLEEADAQLERYRSDPRIAALQGASRWKAVSILFVGLGQVYWRELGSPTRKLEPDESEG